MGVCGGNYKKFWILRWASFIFRLLPSLNKCVPFLLGRYSTTMRGECEQECFSYLLSSMWFPAAVRLSTLFGGHIVSGSLLRIFDSHRVLLSTSLKSLSIQSVATIKCTQGKAFGDWGVVKTSQPAMIAFTFISTSHRVIVFTSIFPQS